MLDDAREVAAAGRTLQSTPCRQRLRFSELESPIGPWGVHLGQFALHKDAQHAQR